MLIVHFATDNFMVQVGRLTMLSGEPVGIWVGWGQSESKEVFHTKYIKSWSWVWRSKPANYGASIYPNPIQSLEDGQYGQPAYVSPLQDKLSRGAEPGHDMGPGETYDPKPLQAALDKWRAAHGGDDDTAIGASKDWMVPHDWKDGSERDGPLGGGGGAGPHYTPVTRCCPNYEADYERDVHAGQDYHRTFMWGNI